MLEHRALVGVGHVLVDSAANFQFAPHSGRADDVAGDALAVDGRDEDEGRHRGGGEHQGREREEPPHAAGVEVADRDRAGPGDLVDQQPGDEEARQHEEDVDADEAAAARPATPAWKSHDQHDGDGPQPLDVAPEAVATLTPRPWRRQVGAGQGVDRHTS